MFCGELGIRHRQQNDESHYDDNCVQHEKTTVPAPDERINGLGAGSFWRMARAASRKNKAFIAN